MAAFNKFDSGYRPAYGSRTAGALTHNNLANAAGRQSLKVDLGAARATAPPRS